MLKTDDNEGDDDDDTGVSVEDSSPSKGPMLDQFSGQNSTLTLVFSL